MPAEPFQVPLILDLAATFVYGITGALVALKRGYDFVGLFALTFVTGVGGGLIRDGIFLQQGPPAVTLDSRYLQALLLASVTGWLLGERINRVGRVILVIDALGLGAYGVVGIEKSLAAGLSTAAALLVGVVNACGGGLLRDVLVREEPLVFKPGEFYALIALVGCALHLLLTLGLGANTTLAACAAILVTFLLRLLALRFNWKTTPLRSPEMFRENAD